eukprot:Rmarinus@m.22913
MPTALDQPLVHPVADDQLIGGRLRHFRQCWEAIGPSHRLRSIIQDGLWWPIMWGDIGRVFSKPTRDSFDILRRHGQIHLLQAMEDTVAEYLRKGLVKPCDPSTPGLVSLFFPVRKKNGKWRGCLDLRQLNELIPCPHFKMESLADVRHVVRRNDYLTKIDISDAYSHVPIHPSRRRFLRFLWRGVMYEFVAMPFGLNIAPREFTKLLRPVIGFLRERGVRCIIYLDDILVVAESMEESHHHTKFVLRLLRRLGFVVNDLKCHLSPCKLLEFLGMMVDTEQMTFRVPADKIKNLLRQIKKTRRLHDQRRLTAWLLASLTGKMVSVAAAIRPARLFSRQLLYDMNRTLAGRRSAWEGLVNLSQGSLDELDWWSANLHHFNGRRFDVMEPTTDLYTDASDTGWGGAMFRGSRTVETWGFWESNPTDSINSRELKAVLLTLQALQHHLWGEKVLVRTDNATTLAYLRNQGGRHPHLTRIMKQIHEVCTSAQVELAAEFLPGRLNTIADRLSRMPKSPPRERRWEKRVLRHASRLWGRHTVDAFANPNDPILRRFWTARPHPHSLGVNALMTSWKSENVWAHPPRNLIRLVFQKILNERLTATLVLPYWPTQTWWPVLLKLLQDDPIWISLPSSPPQTLLVARISAQH